MNDFPMRTRYTIDSIPVARKERRVLLFAKHKRHTRVTAHLIRGFQQNGHRVLWINTHKVARLLGNKNGLRYTCWRMRRFQPDMVLIYSKDATVDMLDAVPNGVLTALFYQDLFYAASHELIELGRRCSIMFTTARGNVPDFKSMGVRNVSYIRGGCDPTDHFPDSPDPGYFADVAFIGSANMPNRTGLLRAIAERFSLKLYGQGWESALRQAPARRHVYPKQYRKICASTKIIIGIDGKNDLDLYFSNRTWLTLGCGGFLLTRYVPNLEEYFTNHEHLVWFQSVEECLELIDYYLPRESERRRIANTGCEYVRMYHTFRHATAEIMARTFGEKW